MLTSPWRTQSVDRPEMREAAAAAEGMEDADSLGDLYPWRESGHVLVLPLQDACGNDSCLVENFPLTPHEDSLRLQAALVLSKAVNRALIAGGTAAIASVVAYLSRLDRPPLTSVMTQVGRLRPRFLPLEYHWAPTEKDPFLCLLESLPPVDALRYVPHPLVHPQLEGVLCLHARLSALCLKEGADDSLLRIVGNVCCSLAFLDICGSKAVTDCGLRRLLLRPPAASRFHWRQLYRRWRELRSSLPPLPGPTVSYHPIFVSAPSSPALEPSAQRTPVAFTLTHLDLRATKVSFAGAEWASKRLEKGAHVLLQPQAPKGHRRIKSSSSEEGKQSLLAES